MAPLNKPRWVLRNRFPESCSPDLGAFSGRKYKVLINLWREVLGSWIPMAVYLHQNFFAGWSQASSTYVQMWELDHREGWVPKKWCFWTVMLQKTLESPLNSNVIKPVNPKGNQPWIFTGRTDAEAEAPILWPPSGTHWKRPWCWKRVRAGEGDNGGWNGWMASSTQWTWVWANSGR